MTNGQYDITERSDGRLTNAVWLIELARVLRPHGYIGIAPETGATCPASFQVGFTEARDFDQSQQYDVIFFGHANKEAAAGFGLRAKAEVSHQLLYWQKRRWFRRVPAYHPLRPFLSFEQAADLEPLIVTLDGRVVVGWRVLRGRRQLVCGFDPVAEFCLYTHGDPDKAGQDVRKNLWSPNGHEQPAYLYSGHLARGHESAPWVDQLGAWLSTALSSLAGIPQLHPLPHRARGLILLTGDDDQAQIEKYRYQQELLGGFPITYFMMDCTNHTPETLAELSPATEFGVHVDGLPAPEGYEGFCDEQLAGVRQLLAGHPIRSIRNHGHLNRGYWGHLAAWHSSGLTLDLNVRGLDGTCPTGSFLPFSVSAHGLGWGEHYSLFSTFSDSMGPYQGLSERQQAKLIKRFASQIEAAGPGILVFNLHPQNVQEVERVHRTLMSIANRSGWRAVGVSGLLDWIEAYWSVRLVGTAGEMRVEGLDEALGVCLVSQDGQRKLCHG